MTAPRPVGSAAAREAEPLGRTHRPCGPDRHVRAVADRLRSLPRVAGRSTSSRTTEPLSQEDLAAIRARAEGGWVGVRLTIGRRGDGMFTADCETCGWSSASTRGYDRDEQSDEHERDCERIWLRGALAAARSDVLALLALVERLQGDVARVREVAESWRYKGEFGWGAWQEGEGPDEEGWHLDRAAAAILAALDGPAAGGER